MKKHGFTLIEMLAVIVILAIVATIIVTSAYSLVNSNKQEQFDVLIKELNQATKLYLDDNYENYVVGRESKYISVRYLDDMNCSSTYVQLSELVNANLIKASMLVDPRNNSNIAQTKYLKVFYSNSSVVIDDEFYESNTLSCTNFTYSNGNYSINNTNNYLSLNNMLFRIIKINKDGSLKVASDGDIGSSVFGKTGSYSESYVLSNIQYWYTYDVASVNKPLIRESSLSLLTEAEYNSLSYLQTLDEVWLLTGNTGVTNSGNVSFNTYSAKIKVTFDINPNAIYVGGNGSQTSPYTIR